MGKHLSGSKTPNSEAHQDHSLAISSTGQLFGWGKNQFGQLGLGETEWIPQPTLIPLPFSVKQAAAQFRHTLVLSVDGRSLFGFGECSHGQLGPLLHEQGSRQPVLPNPSQIPRPRIPLMKNKRKVRSISVKRPARQQNQPIDLLEHLPDHHGLRGTAILSIATGMRHSVLLDMNGNAWGIGDNRFGQICSPKGEKMNVPVRMERSRLFLSVHAGWNFTALEGSKKTHLLLRGRNNYGQLGSPEDVEVNLLDFPSPISQVASGSEHCGVLLGDGSVYLWGWNEHGQLGNGTIANSSSPCPLPLPSPATFLSSGSAQCFVSTLNEL